LIIASGPLLLQKEDPTRSRIVNSSDCQALRELNGTPKRENPKNHLGP
jgi:hypothetical protein